MELIIVIFMLLVGGSIALSIMIPVAAAQRESETAGGAVNVTDRNHIASSILYTILVAGGMPSDNALREIRRGAGLAAPFTSAVDVASWAERYARNATAEQRGWLLDVAVQLVAAQSRPVPIRQYSSLLDLSFGLGFQTDALAKLRDQYGFDYVDHARSSRPREVDRSGGSNSLFVRDTREEAELLSILGIRESASRQVIISAYRRLAAQHHPDRVFRESSEVQSEAAAKFIEITRAYETLLTMYRE